MSESCRCVADQVSGLLEFGFTFPPGTYVGQSYDGGWFWFPKKPVKQVDGRHPIFDGYAAQKEGGDFLGFFQEEDANPHWEDTLHQVQAGEVIWLSLGG